MRAHIIDGGAIVNTIVVTALDALPGVTLIDADLHHGNIGDGWDGVSVIPAAPPFDRQAAARQIDDAVAAIYQRFSRFSLEYQEREAQAVAYKSVGYTGTVPPRIAEFATPAAMPAQAATDLILSQASSLRTALERLSGLRMRKYEVLRASSSSAAESVATEILAAVAAIAAQVT